MALPMTVLNDACERFMLMPAWAQDDFSAFINCVVAAVPVANWRLKASLAPAGMPAPHWLAAVPGDCTGGGAVRARPSSRGLFSSEMAVDGLYL